MRFWYLVTIAGEPVHSLMESSAYPHGPRFLALSRMMVDGDAF